MRVGILTESSNLLPATLQKDEEFAWEDEEEESTANPTPLDQSTITPKVSVDIPNSGPTTSAETEGKKTGPTSSSPRESSEDSYDLVSTRSGNASGTALAAPAPTLSAVLEAKEKKEDDEDSGDSDWE